MEPRISYLPLYWDGFDRFPHQGRRKFYLRKIEVMQLRAVWRSRLPLGLLGIRRIGSILWGHAASGVTGAATSSGSSHDSSKQSPVV